MIQSFVFSVAAALFAAAVFFIGATLMSAAAGHGQIASALKGSDKDKPLAPLNTRLTGYTVTDVQEVWDRIRTVDGEFKAERLYLKMDLVFPLFYGIVLAGCMALVQRATSCNCPWIALYAPIGVIILADWVENTTQLRLIGKYADPAYTLDASMVQLASCATMLKLAAFGLSVVLIIALPLFAQTASD